MIEDRAAMISARRMRVVFLTAVLLACACAQRRDERPKALVLATVNGAPITADDLAVKLGDHAQSDPSLKEKALDVLIAEELMFQKAVKLGFDKDPKFQERIRGMEAQIAAYKRAEMGRRVRDTQIASKVNVTDDEVRDYYAQHSEELAGKDNPGAGLESVKPAIERKLWAAKGREAYEQYIAQLKQGASITRSRAK